MNAPLPKIVHALTAPFADVPPTPAQHFRLALFAVIAHLIEVGADGDRDAAIAAHPFLADYAGEIARRMPRAEPSIANWRAALDSWERNAGTKLPLRALHLAGLSRLELELMLAAGLSEEDPRFSDLFEDATARERRPTAGLLIAWWRIGPDGEDRADEVRRCIFGLVRSGLLQVLNPAAPRSEWALMVAPAIWDALRGEPPALPWLRHVACGDLPALEHYVAPPALARTCQQLPRLIAERPMQMLVVRGASQNGRKTLVSALARALGKGLLLASDAALEDEALWRLFGALAVTLDALPVVEVALSAGENRRIPALPLVAGPVAIVTGARGGIASDGGHAMLSLTLPLPDAACRRAHWRAALPTQSAAVLDQLAQSVRLTSGNIARAARAASCLAQLEGRATIGAGDVQLACRGLHNARLETVATRLDVQGDLNDLACDELTRGELEALLTRCRYREALGVAAGGESGGAASGVRALFAGSSGTGKTLAARLLAASLGKDLYRVDLAAAVNKYLGETEKNLDRAFSAAEELDVILLLDEGDALMATRTDVGTSNDRYANLETNFLLQRIESYHGILLVTTNAVERIDKAFARRMDVVITLRAPDDLRRYEILRLHLGEHCVDDELLQEIACRCPLTGGQLRNIALHARLLALQAERPLSGEHLHAALIREYRKIGAHCPLKRSGTRVGEAGG
jgi:histone H3/H4